MVALTRVTIGRIARVEGTRWQSLRGLRRRRAWPVWLGSSRTTASLVPNGVMGVRIPEETRHLVHGRAEVIASVSRQTSDQVCADVLEALRGLSRVLRRAGFQRLIFPLSPDHPQRR